MRSEKQIINGILASVGLEPLPKSKLVNPDQGDLQQVKEQPSQPAAHGSPGSREQKAGQRPKLTSRGD